MNLEIAESALFVETESEILSKELDAPDDPFDFGTLSISEHTSDKQSPAVSRECSETEKTPSTETSVAASSLASDPQTNSGETSSRASKLLKYRKKAKKSKNPATQLQYVVFLHELILELRAPHAEEIVFPEKHAKSGLRRLFGKGSLEISNSASLEQKRQSLENEYIRWLSLLSFSAGTRLPEAQKILACCYEEGKFGVTRDTNKALFLFFQASKSRDAYASYRCAVLYEIEKTMHTHAVFYYRKAATLGNPEAMHRLSRIYMNGELRQKVQPKEAFMWIKRTVSHGTNPEAIYDLASFYQIQTGVLSLEYDEGHAFSLYKQAAAMNYSPAMYTIGICFEKGMLGQKKNMVQAFWWHKKAADNGHVSAQYKVAKIYFRGLTKGRTLETQIFRDKKAAAEYLQKAANSNDPRSQQVLGKFYERGIGVPQCFETSVQWYRAAAHNGDRKAKLRLRELNISESTDQNKGRRSRWSQIFSKNKHTTR